MAKNVAVADLTEDDILERVATKQWTKEQGMQALRELRPASVSNSEPRITESGNIFVMPGLSLTGYQYTKVRENVAKIDALIKGQINGRDSTQEEKGRDDKPYTKRFRGKLLVGYQEQHVLYVAKAFKS